MTLTAGELMRGAGLLVDGPIVWGKPVPSGDPGIFVVELAAPAAEAPLHFDAIRLWLERVPALTLDGERPTTRQLMRRLADFWLPEEQVVFVGRSRQKIGGRVAALYQTALGDDKPNANGHWLKTLTSLPQARVWWAATEAHEEYEDELLSQFVAAAGALPFANLTDSAGVAKAHGLANYLREPDDASKAARAKSAETAAAVARARQPVKRVVRRPVAKAGPPAPAPKVVSASGADALRTELDHLRNNVRPGVIERVKQARELGDLRENADYEAARNEQSFVEGRIQSLEALLRTAVVVDVDAPADGAVSVGSTVVVDMDGDVATWHVVGSNEADPQNGRISYASPVGQALLGHRAGDEVIAQLPRGELRLTVREVS